jgi:glycosyltransferase involved in cell wall biosynthesis
LSIAATLHEARGKYVVILNDDDLLYPKMLEKLVAALEENPQAALVFGNHNVMDADGMVLSRDSEELMRERGRVGLKPGMVPDSFDFAVRGGLMVVMGCLFRKSACDTKWLTPEVAGAYDYWLSVMLSTQGEFLYTSENVMSWRRHTDSLSSSPPPTAYACDIHIYESLLNTPLSKLHRDYINERLAECFFRRGIHLLESGWCVLEVRKFFYKSLLANWSFVALRYWVIYFFPVSARRYIMQTWRTISLWKQRR